MLSFTAQNGISGAYNAATGVLTLTGTASVANYKTALDLDHVQRQPRATATRPMAAAITSRTISWVVTDGNTSNGSSIAATSTLTVVHAVPVVTAGGTSTFTGGGSAVTLDGALTVSDADSGGDSDRCDGVDRCRFSHWRQAELHEPEWDYR